MRMSNELPPYNPSDDESEYSYEYSICEDVGMEQLLNLMMEAEDEIANSASSFEVSLLMENLSAAFEQEGVGETELKAIVHGKIRPEIQYNTDQTVSSASIEQIEASGFYPLADENGPYRQLAGEQILLIQPTVFSTYNPQTDEDYTHQVGFWCEAYVDDEPISCYLHPDDIEDMDLVYATRSGADRIVAQFPDFYKELQIHRTEAYQDEAFVDWLSQMYLAVPDMSDEETERLRFAAERYIENWANFDKEPYQLIAEDYIEIEDDYGQRHVVETYPNESNYIYVQGIELEEKSIEDEAVWIPAIRARLVGSGPLSEATLRIPIDSLLTLTPTATRGGQLVSEYVRMTSSEYADVAAEEGEDQPDEPVSTEELHDEYQSFRSVYEQIEGLQSPHYISMMEYMKDSVQYKDLLAVADELLEAYNIPSIAWQDPDKRDQAAREYRKNRDSYRNFSHLSFEDQERIMRLDREYAERLERDETMTREILLAMFHKRLNPKMTSDEHTQLRQELYAKLTVDYQEPLGTNWYELVDAVLPGESIDNDHVAIQTRRDENEEQKRRQRLREAAIRNGISELFYGGAAVDTDEEMYQLYRTLCDELAVVPYLHPADRQSAVAEASTRFALPVATVEQLVAIIEQAASRGA